MFKVVTITLALVGFMFLCTVAVCYAGWTRACVIDLMPVGSDIMCAKQPNKR